MTSQPSVPCKTNRASCTGAAPCGNVVAARYQSSRPTPDDQISYRYWSPAGRMVTRCTVPALASRSSTCPAAAPPRPTLVHVPPPSWVAQSSGPNAHPSLTVAKRIRLIACGAGPVASTDATGAPIRCHVLPASPVRRTAVHGPVAQRAEPRTKPSFGDTNVTDTALNPAGTSAPATVGDDTPVSGSGPGTADGDGVGPGEMTRTVAR